MSAKDRFLVIEAAVQLLCAWLGLRVLSLPTLRRLLGGSPVPRGVGRRRLSIEGMRRVTWAVSATARRLPVNATCLVEALAAEAMLRRRGCACDLRLGVLPPGRGLKPLTAHAWIEHEGVVMLGHVENLSDYALLSAPRGL